MSIDRDELSGRVPPTDDRVRVRIAVSGAVQGVGFRPFVYRLARGLGLTGWVCNSNQGVTIEVEGARDAVGRFRSRLRSEAPPLSVVERVQATVLPPEGTATFDIQPSRATGAVSLAMLPDIATCPDCLREIFDASDRRSRYPFTNCTHCGPRFSIIEALPYDRPLTTMKSFEMCDACAAEYADPLDRRFHAQANACPVCGPWLSLLDAAGHVVHERDGALREAARAAYDGAIVAVKGLGGFHLIANAYDGGAVERLRARKQRDEKPLAVMMASLEMVRTFCDVSAIEAQLLTAPEAPIVLVRRKPGTSLAAGIAPGNPNLGVMLPYTPLHHLLMAELGVPIIATSGNMSEEPICIDGVDARARLGHIADLFLDHNRPIVLPLDDSIVRVVAGRPLVLRRARGYAPAPVRLATADPPPQTLAVGAHLKSVGAVSTNSRVVPTQHLGDLSGVRAYENFKTVTEHFERLYGVKAERVVCDMHPGYRSSIHAHAMGVPVLAVQHHFAHVLACIAEHGVKTPLLGVCWDGTGYGTDGTIWGGEFLRVDGGTFSRAAHLKTFRLPGGEQAIKEPRRSALGLLYEVFGNALLGLTSLPVLGTFSERERGALFVMLRNGVRSPITSSAGRIFDGVAALVGLRQYASFEGQAAMALEFACDGQSTDRQYPFEIIEAPSTPAIIDWAPMIRGVLDDLDHSIPAGEIAAVAHNSFVEMIVRACEVAGEPRVVLTGGCFQNAYLTERAVKRLERSGFEVYWHERIPPNDGGIAVGQMVAAALESRGGN